jgi:hypothetical protein
MPVSNLKPLNLFSEGQPKACDSSNSGNNGEKSTHIEVCARVRPLQISMLSSSSYFGGNEDHISKDATSPARKPPVPRKPRIPTPLQARINRANRLLHHRRPPTKSSFTHGMSLATTRPLRAPKQILCLGEHINTRWIKYMDPLALPRTYTTNPSDHWYLRQWKVRFAKSWRVDNPSRGGLAYCHDAY